MEKLIDRVSVDESITVKKTHLFQPGNPVAWCGSKDKIGKVVHISEARQAVSCETCLQKLESRGY